MTQRQDSKKSETAEDQSAARNTTNKTRRRKRTSPGKRSQNARRKVARKRLLRRAYESGLNIIPQDDRIPLIRWGRYTDKRIPRETFERWLRSYVNSEWAVLGGPKPGSGVFILDVDDPELASRFKLQPFVNTPSGNHHAYVKHPGFECRNGKVMDGLELKWTMPATFLGPGRSLADGRRVLDWDELPEELRNAINERRQEANDERRAPLPDQYSDFVPENDLLEEALERVREDKDGGRNHTGLWLACQLRDELQTRSDTENRGWRAMRQFQRSVETNGRHPYTRLEAWRTWQHVYRSPPRYPRSLRDPKTFDRVFQQTLARETAQEHLRLLKADHKPLIWTLSLRDELEQERTEPDWTVRDLHQDGTNTIIAGLPGVGKSFLVMNYVRCRAERMKHFLHQAISRLPRGMRVGYVNWEMTEDMFLDELKRMGIKNDNLIAVLHLRDRTFAFTNPQAKEEFLAWIRDRRIYDLILDTRRRLMVDCGLSEMNPDHAAEMTRLLDQLKGESGIRNTFMTAHTPRPLMGATGKEQPFERPLGPVAWDAWADNVWFYGKEDQTRFLQMNKVRGSRRDPGWTIGTSLDKETNLLSATGIGRVEIRKDNLMREVLVYVKDNPGCTQTDITGSVKGRDGDIRKCLTNAVNQGLMDIEERGRGSYHTLTKAGSKWLA